MAYLKIKRSAMGPYRRGLILGFTFKVEVVEAVGLQPEIFVFLRVPKPSDPVDSDDVFQNIAAPADLEEYPAAEPNPETNHPFFRLSEVTLRFRSETIADDAWRCMQTDFEALLTALAEAANLEVEEVVEYGTKPSSSSSSSS
ncbi:MAG TPA: hypothetical protein VNA25_08315 [Phycisphaerae bacterium]|nr:hypothetical protein [Phycisphaerae bacterium]